MTNTEASVCTAVHPAHGIQPALLSVAKVLAALTAVPSPSAGQSTERRAPYLVKEVASALRVSVHTIYRAIESGQLTAMRIGSGRGSFRIPVAAFEDYKARAAVNASGEAADSCTATAGDR